MKINSTLERKPRANKEIRKTLRGSFKEKYILNF